MSLKKKLLLMLFSVISIILYSKELRIKVIDKDLGIPLEGVQINISQNENPFFTGSDGEAVIIIDDATERLIISCSMIGYEVKKLNLKDFNSEATVEMTIEGMLEGQELVIEDSYYKAKEEVGKSIVVDKEELKTLAMRGTVEDVISSIKTMPGVSYSAGFMTDLSIRGSDTFEVAASYDGFIVRDPFYWGSGVSMFNPNIVDSVKFNNGFFSPKYGYAMSGLLDVNVKTPNEGFKIDTKLAYSTFESYAQTPMGLGDKMGLLFGGRITYLEATIGPIWYASGVEVPRIPYIYEGNLKWFYKPTERIEWYVNGFFGADGAGFGDTNEVSDGIDYYSLFDNQKLHAIGFTGLKILPTDKIFINWLAGYEFISNKYTSFEKEDGQKDYSQSFKDKYGITKNSFNVDIESDAEGINLMHSIQSRLDTEFQLHEKVMLGFGGDIIYDFINHKFEYNYFNDQINMKVTEKTDFGNSRQFNNSGYLNFNFYPVKNKLEIEVGIRINHFVSVMDSYILNSYPVADPRFYIAYTPYRGKVLEEFTISFGSGLYSMMPYFEFDREYPVDNFRIKQERVFTNVVGFEFTFPYGINLKTESYFKYYFDKYYANEVINSKGEAELKHHSDGYGYAGGFDIILKRKISRYLDGWISYSFIYVKYYNPKTDGLDQKFTDYDDPTGQWYYPSYHRWHSMNIILNIKPTNWLTISPSFGIHSGVPKKIFDIDDNPTPKSNGGDIMETYNWETKYSDTERTLPSLPFSMKVTFHNFFPRRKIGMEVYASLDNIFSFFWTPDRRTRVDKYKGKEVRQSPEAYEVFLPSFGVKLTF